MATAVSHAHRLALHRDGKVVCPCCGTEAAGHAYNSFRLYCPTCGWYERPHPALRVYVEEPPTFDEQEQCRGDGSTGLVWREKRLHGRAVVYIHAEDVLDMLADRFGFDRAELAGKLTVRVKPAEPPKEIP